MDPYPHTMQGSLKFAKLCSALFSDPKALAPSISKRADSSALFSDPKAYSATYFKEQTAEPCIADRERSTAPSIILKSDRN